MRAFEGRSIRLLIIYWIVCFATVGEQWSKAEGEASSSAELANSFPLKVVGVTVRPHQMPEGIEFSRQKEQLPGGRVQLFVRNMAAVDSKKPEDSVNINVLQFNESEPKRKVFAQDWAWEDTPADWMESDTTIPPGALTVFSYNSLSPEWAKPGSHFELSFTDWLNSRRDSLQVTIPEQDVKISSLCFLSTGVDPLRPDSLVFYVENQSKQSWQIASVRIYQPYLTTSFRLLNEIASLDRLSTYPTSGIVRPGQKTAAVVKTPGHLKLTMAVIEVVLEDPIHKGETLSLWEQLRVRRESFDIGAGWISANADGTNVMTFEPWLKTLKRLHINVANIQNIPGYTDQTGKTGLYTLYPIKYMGVMQPLPEFDTDARLPWLHAAEPLGNAQDAINGCSPQDALELLRIYSGFRIPTSLILTDPWKWRHYAGISDYPQFNVTRLGLPNEFELWELYTNRWDRSQNWAAPLETMGELTRNLRDISRPISIAAWVQGPFDHWTGLGMRSRLAPTPNELRALAWQALSSRVTSLHWFNLNIGSLVKYRDLIPVIRDINREARMLEVFFLYGDSWKHETMMTTEEKTPQLDWDLSSIICPRGALLCALDMKYNPDRMSKTFKFKRPREACLKFSLPTFLLMPLDVFRVDANGVYDVDYQVTSDGVEIRDKQFLAAIYVATRERKLRTELENRRKSLVELENYYGFDPVLNRKDFDLLKAIAEQTGSIVTEDPVVEDTLSGAGLDSSLLQSEK